MSAPLGWLAWSAARRVAAARSAAAAKAGPVVQPKSERVGAEPGSIGLGQAVRAALTTDEGPGEVHRQFPIIGGLPGEGGPVSAVGAVAQALGIATGDVGGGLERDERARAIAGSEASRQPCRNRHAVARNRGISLINVPRCAPRRRLWQTRPPMGSPRRAPVSLRVSRGVPRSGNIVSILLNFCQHTRVMAYLYLILFGIIATMIKFSKY